MQSLSTSPSRAQKDDSDGKKEKKAMAVNAVLGVFFFFFPPSVKKQAGTSLTPRV